MLLEPGAGRAADRAPAEAPSGPRVLDRCENCGVALAHGEAIDLTAEWEAVCTDGDHEARTPNRASVQAALAGAGWAAIDLSPGRLLHTPASLRLLAEHNRRILGPLGSPRWGRPQAWMWQSLLNGLTFHPNFAREVSSGRLRFGQGRGRLAFVVDAIVTVLGAPLVALVSVPLELVAALLGRGGEMRAAVGPQIPESEAGRG